jgi:hypothetical protein
MVHGTAGAMRRFRGTRTTIQGEFPATSTATPDTIALRAITMRTINRRPVGQRRYTSGVGENSMQTFNESLLMVVLALLVAALLVVTFVSVHVTEYQTVAH